MHNASRMKAPPPTLKSKTISSILWSVARTGWATVVSFLVFAFLARFLGPSDFGKFALASLAYEVARIIGNSGLPDAVVREAALDEVTADTVFWACIALNVVVAAVLFAAAPLYEAVTGTAGVSNLVRWLSVMLPLAAFGTIHAGRMARGFGHQRLAIQGFVVSAVAGSAAIFSAYQGMGPYSLVVQVAVTGALGSVMSWCLFRWVPGLQFDLARLRKCLHFGVSMMSTQLIWILTARLQEPFIGRAYGTDAVGQYRVAWRLIELIGQTVLAPIGSVTVVTLSNLQADPQRFASAFRRLVIAAGMVTLPLMFGFGALAIEAIGLAFGPQWKSAAPVAEILVLMAVPFFLNYLSSPGLAAMGRSAAILRVSLLQLTLTAVLTWLATPFGMLAVAAAYVLRAYITAPVQLVALRKAIGGVRLDIWRSLLPVIAIAALVFGSAWLVKPVVKSWLTSDLWLFVILGAASLGLYAALLFIFQRREVLNCLEPLFKPLVKKVQQGKGRDT